MKKIAVVACLLFLTVTALFAPTYRLVFAWDPNPEPDIAGYKLYMGLASGVYFTNWSAGNMTGIVVRVQGYTNAIPTNYSHLVVAELGTNQWPAEKTYFAATAFNTSGLESDFSNELIWTNTPATPPPPPGNLRRTP